MVFRVEEISIRLGGISKMESSLEALSQEYENFKIETEETSAKQSG